MSEQRRTWAAVSFNVLALVVIAVTLSCMPVDDRFLAAPMLAVIEVVLIHFSVLWCRDGAPPVFEAGTLWVLATGLYGAIPLAGFLTMRGYWHPYADSRLQSYDFSARELGAFGWRYVVYGASFVVTYLITRGRVRLRTTALAMPRPATITAILTVFTALYLFKLALKIAYGLDFDVSYTRLEEVSASALRMPYVLQQISHNVVAALLVVQQAILLLLLCRWRSLLSRLVLVGWLSFEIVAVVTRLGSRTQVVLLVVSAGMLFHRLVKPVSFRVFLTAGALLLAGFLVVGAIRGVGLDAGEQPKTVLMATNEFQGLFATAFDLEKRKDSGRLSPVPWQLYAFDFYMIIPSQILPFEKIEPSSWYSDAIGQRGSGVGFMFGVISQAVLGFGWIELVIRGAVLAALLALLHRWYVRHAKNFWPTLFYLFVSIWTYYTFRATSFWFVYFIVYQFVPVMLVTRLVEAVLTRSRRALLEVHA